MSFQLKHLIFPVGKPCKLTVQCQFPLKVDPQEQYSVKLLPFSGLRPYGTRGSKHAVTAADEAFFAENHAKISNRWLPLVKDIRCVSVWRNFSR